MAGKQIKDVSQVVTAGTSTGYVTVASTTGFYKTAYGSLMKNGYSGMEIQITEIVSATVMGVRRVRGMGEGPNYGRDSMVLYAPEIRLAYNTLTSPFNVGATVTGGTSAATGVILSIVPSSPTAGYLVIGTVVGTFQAAELLADDGGVPGGATAVGAQATTSATICLPAQLIYNSNDAPLT